jgi:hypothetical protein
MWLRFRTACSAQLPGRRPKSRPPRPRADASERHRTCVRGGPCCRHSSPPAWRRKTLRRPRQSCRHGRRRGRSPRPRAALPRLRSHHPSRLRHHRRPPFHRRLRPPRPFPPLVPVGGKVTATTCIRARPATATTRVTRRRPQRPPRFLSRPRKVSTVKGTTRSMARVPLPLPSLQSRRTITATGTARRAASRSRRGL